MIKIILVMFILVLILILLVMLFFFILLKFVLLLGVWFEYGGVRRVEGLVWVFDGDEEFVVEVLGFVGKVGSMIGVFMMGGGVGFEGGGGGYGKYVMELGVGVVWSRNCFSVW